jgi:hypothetical protein
MKKFLLTVLVYSLLHVNSVYSEVQQVTLRFNNVVCNAGCQTLLQQKLQQMAGVQNATVNGGIGAAYLTYQPNQPFNYQNIRYAFSAVGLYLQDIRAQVRGMVTAQGNGQYYINSLDDGTVMQIVSAPAFNNGRTTAYKSIYVYNVDEALKGRLDEAIQKNVPIIVEGPLFEIYRYENPPILIVNSLKYDPPRQPQ